METNVVHPGQSINNDRPNVSKSMSRFPQSFQVAGTYRFGEIAPFFMKEAVKGDHDPLQSSHVLRSLNLKSPLLSGLTLKKDFYQVPYEAILPFNWEKIFVQPINGDDVPLDALCNISLDFFNALIAELVDSISSAPTFGSKSDFEQYIRHLVMIDMICGAGSLPSALNLHFDRMIDVFEGQSAENRIGWSAFFDSIFRDLEVSGLSFGVNFIGPDGHAEGVIYRVGSSNLNYPYSLSWREFIYKIEDNLNFAFTGSPSEWTGTLNILRARFATIYQDGLSFPVKLFEDLVDSDRINIAPLWAYQLCCAEFYVNDRVDDLYSAQLFRQYIFHCIQDNFDQENFVYNGLSYQYDYLSGHYFDLLCESLFGSFGALNYFTALFGFRRSLRFVDYFTGAKTRPLAVGDTNVSAAGGVVSIIDTIHRIQATKFYQNVNRIGRKFQNYLKEMFPGGTPAYDWHSPKWLGHTSDGISALETQNTGEAQLSESNSITSNLRTNASRYAFQVDIDRPSVLLGLQYFDVPRFYMQTWDRVYWHTDRFEMFNPDMQFVGDQPIYKAELYHDSDFKAPFGYQSRYMDYKQSYNYGFGGFADNLPSWIFKADDKLYGRGTSLVIGSDYIRSRASELDPYFVSLTGYSNGSYWHFIQINTNGYNPDRPMIASPGLL